MRSLANQSDSELGGPLSVLVLQKHDHVRLDDLLRAWEGPSPGAAQERTLRATARLVFPHAFAEESVLWPELRRVLPDGEDLTLQVEEEHQQVNELWVRLEGMATTDPERSGVLADLSRVLREDVRDEEDELLPRLQDAVGPTRLRALGAAWIVVRRTAPTRPHPVVSRRPPGNVAAALPLTLVDRARDVLETVPRRSPRLGETSAAASRRLEGLAARVERSRLLRRGERPPTAR